MLFEIYDVRTRLRARIKVSDILFSKMLDTETWPQKSPNFEHGYRGILSNFNFYFIFF